MNYETILTMDADGTHDPKYIRKLLKFSKQFDLISTNRFIKKFINRMANFQKILTKIRYYLINILLNINYDSSGAYRCYNAKESN